jgi:predicted O-linked N-acetylglucosamine transferase (SPINDLY family)
MEPHPIETASLDRSTDTIGVAPLPADTPSWLAALLAAYPVHAIVPPRESEVQASEIQGHLQHVAFVAIVTAIERARPDLAGHAEIRLYQDWIAGNAGGSPHLYAAWFNLGAALTREGAPNRAAVAYCNARELNPTFCPAAVNLGLALEAMGQPDAALQTWGGAVQTDESRTTLLNHTARLMERLGRLNEAEAILRTSLLTDPAQPDAVQHWLHIRQKTCRWPVLATDIPGLPPAELLRQSGPLAALALTDDVDVQRELAASWIARKMPPAPIHLSAPEGYRHDRIRVGYLSSDFCRHAMSYLIAELFERHDRGRFEIFGYCATIEDGSDIRQRVLGAFDHHHIIRDLSDEQAARLIREDEIDILIDLNGLTAHTRLAVLRWRPAPIQATYLGFVGPVPLPELDYLLCDDFVIPPSQAAAYRPTPLRIARTYQANDSKRAIAGPLSRQDVGLPDDRFVLCCFSNHYKITEAMFAAWMSILCQADQAVLWLTADNAWSQANLRDGAARAGVAPERILFIERSSPELYMSRLGLADLFLDTFPYNAGTVASDAIRMQLPLLTLAGASFASRMAGSLLHLIGARQGIVDSLSEYVAVGTMLATDKHAYASYKRHFTGDAWKTTIGDIAGFTIEFEATLTQLMDKRVGQRTTLTDEQRPSLTTSDVPNASDPENADCGPKDFGVGRVENADFGLVELVTTAERMAQSGKAEISLGLYELWLRHHPADPLRHVAYFNQGTLLSQTGHPEQAAAAFAEAIRLAPTFLPSYINAGLALERLGRLDEAIGYWRQVADRLVPINGECIGHKTTALKHLARVFKNAGDVRRAEEVLRECLDIDPHQHDAIQHWIAVREMQCKWPVIAPWGKLTRSSLMAALSPLALAIHTNDPMFQLANAWRSFERDVIPSPVPRTAGRWSPPTPPTLPQRPLRIGYVSPDLREHAIGFLTAELFELHDRAKVEVFAYHSGRGAPDPLQARIKQTVDHWSDIVGWSDKQAARRIVDDEIDILIDLGGHTGDAPGAAFALRPAPVIVNWLGYPGSMGTPHHQYIIADETIIPPSYEKYYSESVVRLPCYQPTDRKRIIAETPSRREAGLPDRSMVYCCFNGTQKITPAMFRCWMAILARVPHAILWLLSCDAATDERLRQQATLHGISPDRLVFAARKRNAEHLARYPLADLFLDTSPYGAHTTASDALWMGVPVVTVAGHSFASRVCASLVRAAGLAELVCEEPDLYVDHAVELGTRPDMLVALRHRLQAGRDCCTLFDMPLLVRHLESLYEQMWDDYLSGRISEPDLTNFTVYNEIGGELDHESVGCPDLPAYERKYTIAVAYRDSVSAVPPDRRLWAGSGTRSR